MRIDKLTPKLIEYGFEDSKSSIHTRRTMMLAELRNVMSYVPEDASLDEYRNSIIEENITRKKSASNRTYTATYLTTLYSFDQSNLLFHVMRYFWDKDPVARPMLAFITVYMRDYLTRSSWEYIRELEIDEETDKYVLEKLLSDRYGDQFGEKVCQSVSRNLLATWTKSGHLKGRYHKQRVKPQITPEVITFALFISYLFGNHGELLFSHEIVQLLDSSKSELMGLARAAAYKGYILMNHIGDIIDIKFPSYLYPREKDQ